MTNAERIKLLSEFGITEKTQVLRVTGMSATEYNKAIQIDVPSYYNGLFDYETVWCDKWVKYQRTRKRYSLKEEYVTEFIKHNKGKFTIQDICKMVILGSSKVPTIIMENNLYSYMKEKTRINAKITAEVVKKRLQAFTKYKNDKVATIIQTVAILGCSKDTIQRVKVK